MERPQPRPNMDTKVGLSVLHQGTTTRLLPPSLNLKGKFVDILSIMAWVFWPEGTRAVS